MKKGHAFMLSFNNTRDHVFVEPGNKIMIDGYEETVHSVHSIESKPGEVKILGFLEKREESE